MCKKLIVLVFCAAVLFSGAAMAEVDDSGRLIVPEASVAPIIDGELDDVWQNVGEEGVLITDIINAGGNVPPDDDSDLSSTFKVMYDADNFYIYVVIQDSVIDYEFSDYNGDGVEIYFDGDNSKGGSYDGVNDNQIRITVDDVELADIDSSLPVDGSAFKVILTDLGYNIEASFPLETLQIVPENTFGFEVQLNDNDGGGGRETMIRWFSNDNNSWQDSSLFGEAVLTAEPPAALPEGWQSQDIGTTGGSAAESDGTWVISADGADIWGNSDQFHYVYTELTGDATIEARVVNNGEGSNAWAKGGVMIRQSLDADSINVSGFITGGSGDGGTFQWRPVKGDSSSSNRTLTGIAPPYYVRLVREGNTFTVYMSADGFYWAQQGAPPATIEMTDPVLIGLAVTSHQDGEVRTFTFENVRIVKPVDVTAPGDAIQGVPNDGDWPGAETPDLAIDDDTSTKYLHFKGETETTGFQVTPSTGSIVTGLTLTTANDAAERDPIAFEISGSNESIDGPYELIASGEVVDFAQADAWPRFTMNATSISFDNDVAYAHYQVLFPAVRDAASANSMQIAEVELLGVPDPAGPVGHWKLDEGEGDVAVDSSGRGNDGMISNLNGGLGLDGSVWVDDPERGTVISFNGTAEGAFVRAGDIPQMTLTNDFTWAFWAKHNAENTADNDIILGNRKDENAVDFVPRQFIKFTPTKFEWHMNGNGDDNLDYDDIPADVWLHHAVVKTADQLTYYRNGIEASSGTFTQPLDFPQPLFFGGDNEGAEGENWSGLMSDVRIYNRALTENEVIGLAGKTPVDPGTDGLAAYYALENDVLDSSGNGNDGTIVGAPTFVDGPAGYGTAMEFHGLGAAGGGGDYIDCGNDASLDIAGPISIALWIKPGADDPEGQGTETAPMAKAMSGIDPWNWQVRYGWGSPQPYMAFTFNTSPRAWAYVGQNLVRDEWAHIACSHDGTTLKCFLNGEQTDSTPMGQIATGEAPVLIGSDGWGCDWIGAIDEVAIYNRGLSAGEVRYLAGFREMVEPGTRGLAAAYEFEADATDSSGNGNDGTLLGDAHAQGGLLILDGEDDAVAIPGIGDGLTEFTFSMMVYPTVDVVPLQFSGGINTDSWDGGVHLKLNYGTVNVGVNGLAGGDVVGTTIAQPNTWTHLALTVSPDEVAVYVNGEKEGSRTGEAVPAVNVGAATIGAWNNGGTDVQREMTGMMDNVLIYDRALSEAEVRYLASVKPDPMNLVQNPSFEEDEPILDDPDWVHWCTWNDTAGAGSNTTIVDTDSIDGTRSLQIQPKGVENWHFILVNISFAANLDKNYTASFWAKAVAPRPLTVQMKASDNSIDAWGATDFDLTTEWAEYSYTSEVLIDDVKLEFLCAGSEIPFWLDLVSVCEAD